jgi:DNA-binding transcriptional regulator YiaG
LSQNFIRYEKVAKKQDNQPNFGRRENLMEQIQQKAIEIHPAALRKHRKTRRESQHSFWARFGVTQSRGSRFEKGAEKPTPVVILLELYFNGVVTDGDLKQVVFQRNPSLIGTLSVEIATSE